MATTMALSVLYIALAEILWHVIITKGCNAVVAATIRRAVSFVVQSISDMVFCYWHRKVVDAFTHIHT